MPNKWDLQREVGSLDMLISALSNDLIKERDEKGSLNHTPGQADTILLKEMEEALCELRQARGMTKVLLVAMASKAHHAGSVRPTARRKVKRRLCH